MKPDVRLLEHAARLYPRLVEIRRAIHQHPELGFQEHVTAALVADTLSSLGIPVRKGVGGTGVIGYLGSGRPVIALRADMDALPIQERSPAPFASRVPGVMHACGHDGHTAALLGAAMLLVHEDLPGQVRLVFQPAEETVGDDGKSGGRRLLEAGVLDDVDAAAASHLITDRPVGTVLVSPGPVLAATDSFDLTITGIACHGAYPHRGIDAIVLAAQVVNAIQSIVARRIDPMEAGVITVGTIQGGRKANIIADRVELTGTLRSFEPEVRRRILDGLKESCELARAQGGDYTLQVFQGHAATVNDPRMVAVVQQAAAALHLVVDREKPSPVSEDFAIFTERMPGVYYLVGAGFEDGVPRPAHSSRFDFNEAALPVAAAMHAAVALQYLASTSC